jgi:hypothetical protein
MWVGDIGCRMTIVRIGADLLLHSPIPLDAATRSAVDGIGRVRWIAGPNRVLGDYVRAHPEALLCGAPSLAEKRRDLRLGLRPRDRVARRRARARRQGRVRGRLRALAPSELSGGAARAR